MPESALSRKKVGVCCVRGCSSELRGNEGYGKSWKGAAIESNKKQDANDSIEKAYGRLLSRYSSKIQEHGDNASLINSLLHSPLKNARGESRKENPGRSFESSWCKKAIGLSFWS